MNSQLRRERYHGLKVVGAGSRTTIRPVDGLPMLHVEHPTLTGARRVLKAVVDRIGAVVP
jgi:hypothetical protein